MGSSFDQVGIFATNIEDIQTLDLLMAGLDERDETTVQKEREGTRRNKKEQEGKPKIAVPKEYFSDALDPAIATIIHQKIQTLRDVGYQVDEVSLPLLDKGIATYYTLIGAEVSTNMARYDGVRYGMQGDTFGYETISDYITTMRSE
jgi:aspartyl-tRNA(Asn)/glutamyl-tRNA(Gln) amidotransferase subunit A